MIKNYKYGKQFGWKVQERFLLLFWRTIKITDAHEAQHYLEHQFPKLVFYSYYDEDKDCIYYGYRTRKEAKEHRKRLDMWSEGSND
jgi:hypothetical protein